MESGQNQEGILQQSERDENRRTVHKNGQNMSPIISRSKYNDFHCKYGFVCNIMVATTPWRLCSMALILSWHLLPKILYIAFMWCVKSKLDGLYFFSISQTYILTVSLISNISWEWKNTYSKINENQWNLRWQVTCLAIFSQVWPVLDLSDACLQWLCMFVKVQSLSVGVSTPPRCLSVS